MKIASKRKMLILTFKSNKVTNNLSKVYIFDIEFLKLVHLIEL